MTTQENLLRYLKLQGPAAPSGVPTEREEFTDAPPIQSCSCTGAVAEEFCNFDLLGECFTRASFFKPIGLLFLFITISIGEWFKPPRHS
jgi:hypothetical protein